MIAETSSKTGFLRYFGYDQPITGWSFSASTNRSNYRTADSNGYPTRYSGQLRETLTVSGVGYSAFVINPATKEFDIGWYDHLAGTAYYITFLGDPIQSQFNFNYTNELLPPLTWSVTYEGLQIEKKLRNKAFVANDVPLCATGGCELEIWTSDFPLNLGLVKYVQTASILYTFQSPSYYTSQYSNHLDSGEPILDSMVDLTVQGDFDYWLEAVQTNASRKDYRFYYSDTEYVDVPKMVAVSMDNFIMNLVTGQLISAHVQLGASYGS